MGELYVKEIMDGLYTVLKKAAEMYYNGMPDIMEDSEYDDKINLLSSLENKFPEYKKSDSPTISVGYGSVSSVLERVTHESPMLSLDKRYAIEEVADFFEGMYPVIGSLKGDGLTVVLTYENHVLTDAVTRGDGISGDRIIRAARTFANLPTYISFSGKLVLRAEAVITQEVFEQIKGTEEGKNYKNARNLASGTVRNLDPNIVAQRNVKTYVFELVSIEPAAGEEVPEKIYESDFIGRQWLEEMGIPCIEYRMLYSKKEVSEYRNYVQNVRDTYSYGTDGIVFCIDSVSRKKILGCTAKYPKYALAYKFPNKGEVTTVNSISWQPGMFSLTPVVSVDTIEFDGVSVQKATAHNLSFVLGKDAKGNIVRPPLTPGCTVKIERSGEVIPKISKVYFDGTDTSLYNQKCYPDVCPACGAPTQVYGVDLVCKNAYCSGKLRAKLLTAVSRGALNIAGIGEKTADLLTEKKFVTKMSDLFTLHEHYEQLVKLDGYGEKKVKKIISEIDGAKNKPLPNVIAALCIKGVGVEVGRILADVMPNGLIDILCLTYEQLVELDGIGDVLAKNIIDFVNSDDGLTYITTLMTLEYGNKKEAISSKKENTLEGMTFCITGTLSTDRKTFEELIRSYGGKPTGSVSGKTSYLICGDAPGTSKVTKATNLDIPIISEKELMDMVS